MIKQLLILAITTTSSIVSYGQETMTVTFENGKTKKIQHEEDPLNLPTIEIALYPFSITTMPSLIFGYKIEPKYRLNDKISFQFDYFGSYSDDMNEMSGRYEFSKPTYDLNFIGHYSFANKTRSEKRSIPIDYEASENLDVDYVVYKVEVPTTKNTEYRANLGINKNQINSKFSYSEDIFGQYNEHLGSDFYFGGPMSFTSLIVGVEIFKSRSYKIKTDKKVYSYFRTSSIYLNLSYAIAESFDIYKLQPDYTYKKTSKFTDLKKSGLGVRLGIHKSISIKNSGSSIVFGASGGVTPTYTATIRNKKQDLRVKNQLNTFFNFSIGFSFGNNPWK